MRLWLCSHGPSMTTDIVAIGCFRGTILSAYALTLPQFFYQRHSRSYEVSELTYYYCIHRTNSLAISNVLYSLNTLSQESRPQLSHVARVCFWRRRLLLCPLTLFCRGLCTGKRHGTARILDRTVQLKRAIYRRPARFVRRTMCTGFFVTVPYYANGKTRTFSSFLQ